MGVRCANRVFNLSLSWRILLGAFSIPIFIYFYYKLSLYNMEFFHSLAEIFSIFVAFGIFIIAWNTRKFLKDNSLLLFGVAYLFVGIFDLLHAFAFECNNIFPGNHYNVAAQLWLSARYIEGISLAIAPYSLNWKRIKGTPLFIIYTLVSALFLFNILFLESFPVCLIPGVGQTPFKICSEIAISLILLLSIISLLKNRSHFERKILTILLCSIATTILSELSLLFYKQVTDFMFTCGHFLKIISFYLIYKAIIQTGMTRPFIYLNQSQSDLASEKEKLLITLQSIGDGVIVTDADGVITLANNASENLTGWGKEILHESFTKVFYLIDDQTSEPINNLFQKAINSGGAIEIPKNTILVTKDGVERYISGICSPVRDMHGSIIGAALVFRDITLHLRIEDELVKTEKLESIEILSGGIAHDFNNMLAGMMANIELIQLLLKKGKDVGKNLSEVKNAIEKASGLTRQLMTFSKEGTPIKKTSSLGELIQTTVDFNLRGSNTKYDINITENLWAGKIDKGQISQVIGNIIINAAQSMPGGGVVKVEAENTTIVKEDLLPLSQGDYIMISITDKGVGIPKSVLKKIFDPYFTTKKDGNGLGLATSYSIIRKHDGYIEVKSRIGQGTTFIIYLPRSEDNHEKTEPEASQPLTGKGYILIMDDDRVIRTVTGEMLSLIGYEVAFAKNGTEAINRYEAALEQGKPFDVVIMDLTIPGNIGGKEALKSLMEIDPSVKAILSSGYSNHPIIAEYKKHGFSGVLIKPFRVEDLNDLVSKIISEKRLTIAE